MTTLRRHQEHHYPQTRDRLQGISHVRHSATAPRSISDYRYHSYSQSSPSVSPELSIAGYDDSHMSSFHHHQHSRSGSDLGVAPYDERRDASISQYHRDISSSTQHLSIHDGDARPRQEDRCNTFDRRLPVAHMLKPTGGVLAPIKGGASKDDIGGQMLPSIRSTLGNIGIVEHDLPERNNRLSFSRPGLSPPMSPEEGYHRSVSSPHSSTLPLAQVLSPGAADVRDLSRRVESPASTHESSAGSEPPQMPPLQGGSFACKYAGCKAPPFQTQYLLNSHANVHSSARPHYCPVKGCPRSEGAKGFKRKNEMIRHGLVHDSPGYICPFCPDREHRYPRPDNLQRHVRVHHTDKDKDDALLRDVLSQRSEGPNRGRRRRGTNS